MDTSRSFEWLSTGIDYIMSEEKDLDKDAVTALFKFMGQTD
jgi:hypothetical protein